MPLTDVLGRPFAFTLTPGNISDMKAAPMLLSQLNGARYLVADKGYDANALRCALRSRGHAPTSGNISASVVCAHRS